MTTIAQGRAELAALLCADPVNYTPVGALSQVGVVAVYPTEPVTPRKPLSVSIFWAGLVPEYINYEVRVYGALDAGVEQGQSNFDDAVWVIDALIGSTGRFGPSDWSSGVTGERDGLLATNRLRLVRDDF